MGGAGWTLYRISHSRDIHSPSAARTRYYYQVGDFDGGHGYASPIFSVRTAPDAAALAAGALPLRVAVYGDMGVEKGKRE